VNTILGFSFDRAVVLKPMRRWILKLTNGVSPSTGGQSLFQKESEYRARLLGSAYRAANLTAREFDGDHENENEGRLGTSTKKGVLKKNRVVIVSLMLYK
jgi:hypothetical protein